MCAQRLKATREFIVGARRIFEFPELIISSWYTGCPITCNISGKKFNFNPISVNKFEPTDQVSTIEFAIDLIRTI